MSLLNMHAFHLIWNNILHFHYAFNVCSLRIIWLEKAAKKKSLICLFICFFLSFFYLEVSFLNPLLCSLLLNILILNLKDLSFSLTGAELDIELIITTLFTCFNTKSAATILLSSSLQFKRSPGWIFFPYASFCESHESFSLFLKFRKLCQNMPYFLICAFWN